MTHIHIYFKDHQKEEALTLKAKLAQKFPSLILGRFHEKPVGPHPVGSFLVFPKNEKDERAVKYFLKSKIGNLSAMIHPETGDDFEDHRDENIEWIGPEFDINRDIFTQTIQAEQRTIESPNHRAKARQRKLRASNLNYKNY
ncbi:MAG: 4,5-dioxygenase [Rickettsiales bacterium]|nr:4,5-dioxygenase [Rickettsiales bacterium]|tara:strand:+ start:573 stop:998 length:426 start_codon:yes stop_codon:yes gene_type:complete